MLRRGWGNDVINTQKVRKYRIIKINNFLLSLAYSIRVISKISVEYEKSDENQNVLNPVLNPLGKDVFRHKNFRESKIENEDNIVHQNNIALVNNPKKYFESIQIKNIFWCQDNLVYIIKCVSI